MKPKARLTVKFLDSLRPAAKGQRDEYPDTDVPGFFVRVDDKDNGRGKAGGVSFYVIKRLGKQGNPVRRKVGDYVIKPDPDRRPEERNALSAARERARRMIDQMDAGIDPKEAEEAARRANVQARENSFGAVAEAFIADHVSGLRSKKDVEATIRRELINKRPKTDDEPAFEGWAKRPITSITRLEVMQRIGAMKKTRPALARLTLVYIKQIFDWAIDQDVFGLEVSPTGTIHAKKVLGKPVVRDRVLSADEIRSLWAVTDWAQEAPGTIGYPFAPFVRLLLLTGQRLREVAEARWREFDLDAAVWVIPAERMKGDAAHEVPLSPLALENLKALPRGDAGDFVFSTTSGRRPVSGFSKAKLRLDAAIGSLRKGAGAEEMPAWRFHDLRRTLRTNLSALPIPALVAELVIAHSKPGLHKVYDLHAYSDEKRRALELWEAKLSAIVNPSPAGNVVQLASARA